MQLHYGVLRDNNQSIFRKLGPDAGIDSINNYAPSAEMAAYLNALADTDELPKTILYSLNPGDNAAIGTIIGCFQDSSAIGKIQQGSAWSVSYTHLPTMETSFMQQSVRLLKNGLRTEKQKRDLLLI